MIGKCHSCSNYDIGICARSRDSVTSWLTLRDVLDLCDFVTHSYGTVMIGIFACFRDL